MNLHMQAIVRTQYGSPDVLQLKTVDKPTPKAGEVLIKIHAVGLNAADWHLLRGDPFLVRLAYGLRTPKITILGADVAGRVEAVGSGVTTFQPGDAVFGDSSGCGFGGLAEFACARADVLAPKPANLSFEQAAAVPMAGVTALQGLRNVGKIRAGQKVLINGASGGVGTFAIQLAKIFGAEVTAVGSTRNLDLMRSLGADYVIDYTKQDVIQNGIQYDLILAANGYHSIFAYRRALAPKGIYVVSGGAMAQMMQAMLVGPLLSMTGDKKMGNLLARPSQSDLLFLKALLEAGRITPVIDRCYPLVEAPTAMRYLEEGHARGKIVLTP